MSFLPNKDPAGAVNSEQAQQRMDVGVLAGWLFVAVTLAFVAARLYCKFRITKTPWWDDCLITLAWVGSPAPLFLWLSDALLTFQCCLDRPLSLLPSPLAQPTAASAHTLGSSSWNKYSRF